MPTFEELKQETATAAQARAEAIRKEQENLISQEKAEELERERQRSLLKEDENGEEDSPEEPEGSGQPDGGATEPVEGEAPEPTPEEDETDEIANPEDGEPSDEVSGEEGPESETYDSVMAKYDLTYGQIVAAKRMQWTPETIDELGMASPEAVKASLDRFKASFDKLSGQFGQMGQTKAPQGEVAPEEAPEEDGMPRQPRQKSGDVGDEFSAKIEALKETGEVSPEIIALLEAQQREIDGVKQFADNVTQQQAMANQQRGFEIIDRWRNQLPVRYQELLGSEPIGSLDKSSEEYKRLERIVRHADRMAEAYASDGRAFDPFDVLDSALSYHEPNLPIQAAASRVKDVADSQRRKAMGAGNRSSSAMPANSREKTVDAVNRKMRDLGLLK